MLQKTDDTGVDSMMKTVLEANLLKFSAGQAIFCPDCQKVMDWRDTVVATIHARKLDKPDQEEKCVTSYVVCGKDWDRLGHRVVKGVEDANVKLAGKVKARLELVDGREKRFDDID